MTAVGKKNKRGQEVKAILESEGLFYIVWSLKAFFVKFTFEKVLKKEREPATGIP